MNAWIGGWGVTPTGKSFRSFVRARGLVARWNSSPNRGREFSLFPFGPLSFPFSLVWQGVFPPPHPPISYPTLVGLIGYLLIVSILAQARYAKEYL